MTQNYIILSSQNKALNIIKEGLKSGENFILLLGRSGSGKSVLLSRLNEELEHSYDQILFFNQAFFSANNFFESLILKLKLKQDMSFELFFDMMRQDQRKILILLDESGIYEDDLLEKIRLLSDLKNISFVLSSHKKQALFEKDYFKSRLKLQVRLDKLSIQELKNYIMLKFNENLSFLQLFWLSKISKNNLRTIDKIIKSFKDFSSFYQGKKRNFFMLKMSAFHHQVLR